MPRQMSKDKFKGARRGGLEAHLGRIKNMDATAVNGFGRMKNMDSTTPDGFYHADNEAPFDFARVTHFDRSASFSFNQEPYGLGKMAEANKAQMNEILRSDNFKKTANNFYRINNTKNQRNESSGGLLKVVERSDEQPSSKEVYDFEAKHMSPMVRGKMGLLKAKFDI